MTIYNSNFQETVPVSDTCAVMALATNTDQTYTVPALPANTKYQVRFSYTSTSNVFVNLNATATVPGAGTITTGQYNEFRPGSIDGSKRYVKSGDVLHFITPDASAYVGISLVQLPG